MKQLVWENGGTYPNCEMILRISDPRINATSPRRARANAYHKKPERWFSQSNDTCGANIRTCLDGLALLASPT